MDKNYCFERNLLALSQSNGELCSRLQGTGTNSNRYKFLESRSGDTVPAWIDSAGAAHPLHSTIDPEREAKRLIESVEGECFLILLGLGGGYFAEAALQRNDIGMVLVIEYDLNGLAELFCHRNYAGLFSDSRFRLCLDLSGEELEQHILNLYQPVLYGGIRVIPLRSRTGPDAGTFAPAGNAIQSAIDKVSSDYSVQAHFGTRWFSNIIKNLGSAGEFQAALPPISKAAVTAAGPSLTTQISRLKEKRKEFFLIAADTSLPCLLYEGIKPDAVISIDCQHISYYHFMDGLPEGILLFLDLASPPLIGSRHSRPFFFSGGNPLTRYVSRVWRPLPELDTSGGNVTYAAVSLAEQLGAGEIELYGADFSYPHGISYARGTYIYSFFGKRQNRFLPLEAQASSFLFRVPVEKIVSGENWYYETRAMKFYRERLEEKSFHMHTLITPIKGMGATVSTGSSGKTNRQLKVFSYGKKLMSPMDFLCQYQNGIEKIPLPDKYTADYLASVKGETRVIFTTLLPVIAAMKKQYPEASFRELLEKTKAYCDKKINTVLNLSNSPYSNCDISIRTKNYL